MKVPIEEQIAAVEREVMNLAGHIEILRDLIKKKKRDPIILVMQENLLPQLQAALETLRWVKKNKEKFK